jgi:hypothetical protein
MYICHEDHYEIHSGHDDEMIDDHCDTDPVWFLEMFKDW